MILKPTFNNSFTFFILKNFNIPQRGESAGTGFSGYFFQDSFQEVFFAQEKVTQGAGGSRHYTAIRGKEENSGANTP